MKQILVVALCVMTVILAVSARADVFEITWDMQAKAEEAAELAARIYKEGGVSGAEKASLVCHNSAPSRVEVTDHSSYCMAFDVAILGQLNDDPRVKVIEPGSYFHPDSINMRTVWYFADWTPAGMRQFIDRLYGYVVAYHNAHMAKV